MGSNDSIAILIPSSSFFALCIWCLISTNSSNISLTIGFCLSGTWANHSMAMSKIWLAVPVVIPAFIAVLRPWNKWRLGGTIAVAIYLVQPDKSSCVVWLIQYSVCYLLNLKSGISNPQVAYLFIDDTTAYAISVCRTKSTIGFVHHVHSVCTQTPNQAELVVSGAYLPSNFW